MKVMTKTEIKQEAQDMLLNFARHAFYQIHDGLSDLDVEDTESFAEYRRQLDIQYKRIQKLFGCQPTGYKE